MKHPWRWIIGLLVIGFLIALAIIPGGKKVEFEVASEFNREVFIKLPTIGPFDMSITKTVIYLWISVAVILVFALIVARSLKVHPGRFQYAMETLYELAHDGVVGAVMKSGKHQWFPYIGGVFVFVLTANLIGLVPLPFGRADQSATTRRRPISTSPSRLRSAPSCSPTTPASARTADSLFQTWPPPSAPRS